MNLPLVHPATAPASARDLLAEVHRRLGATPNMARAMANAPALLRGDLDLSGALSRGVLSPATRERIALAVAQGNGCSYCLAAHSYLAEQVTDLNAAESARNATSDDPKTAAILAFATAVNDGRGTITSEHLAAARAAGLSDEEMAEIIGHVALNVLTNYFNKAARVALDFPAVAA